MTDKTMQILSWNTRGFGSTTRRRIVRNFISRHYKHVDVIALQELKVTDRTKLEASLHSLLPGGRIIVDYTRSGRGGNALIINPRIRVSETGVSGFGGAAWATVHTASGSIRIASLHAPNTKEGRQTFWGWWDEQMDDEDWILAGDFNNVELPEDSKGKSALMHGAEERTWRIWANRTDSIDAYLTAARTTGGLFTRMAFCGHRYDQARLDRFYLTNRGEWNSQKRWELGWGRIRQILREEKGKQERQYRQVEDIRREVEELRLKMEQEGEGTEEIKNELITKEAELRERDLRDARAWKMRSKERWLREGEAPSRYFYSQLKAKFAREKISRLETALRKTTDLPPDGEEVLSRAGNSVESWIELTNRWTLEQRRAANRNPYRITQNLTRAIEEMRDGAAHTWGINDFHTEGTDHDQTDSNPGSQAIRREHEGPPNQSILVSTQILSQQELQTMWQMFLEYDRESASSAQWGGSNTLPGSPEAETRMTENHQSSSHAPRSGRM
ncbi:hypothetical protein R1sor_016758 [Riccia sorocarpa]|uniref:Endonuclease/exonuclease/phosphatase domain-containing protein n=1 Tax=Riccia sorocarpa TaxID=122646 RepID=A0ABD3HJ86_9MARC